MHAWAAIGLLFTSYSALWVAALVLHRRGHSIPIWFLRSAGVPFICVRQGTVQSSALLRRTSRQLAEVRKVEYAYQAVVGFSAVWVITFQDDKELVVPSRRAGLARALLDLEPHLPGFSIEKWRQAFANGDVEDTLLLWEAEAQGGQQADQP